MIETSYNKDLEKLKIERDNDARNRTEKRNIRVYGYKYFKVLKFIA